MKGGYLLKIYKFINEMADQHIALNDGSLEMKT